MLSDRERETLCQIQRQFWDEDPDLARSLEAAERRLKRDHRRCAYAIVIVVAALLSVFLLVLGLSAGALASAAVAGSAWVARRRRIGLDSRHS